MTTEASSRRASSQRNLPGHEVVPIWRLRAVAYAMICVSVLAIGVRIYGDYDENLQNQKNALRQQARTAAERIGHRITLIDSHLQEILADLPPAALAGPDALRAVAKTPQTYQALRRQRYDLNSLDAFGILDADGNLLASSRLYPLPSPPPSARRGDLYRRLRDHAAPALVIGNVTRSIITGRPIFLMARRILGPEGAFLGFVVAAIDVATLRDSEREFMANDGNAVSLSRADGTILMRNPDDPRLVGMKLANPEWHRLVATGGGVMRSDGKLAGQPLYVSVMPVNGYPLAVNVHMAEDQVLREWYRDTIPMAAITIVAAVGFVALFEALIRRMERQRQQNAQLARQTEALRVAEERFRDFAEMASDWFWEQNADLRYTSVSSSGAGFPRHGLDYVGKTRLELPDTTFDPKSLECHKADLLARRAFRDFRYCGRTPDGRVFHSSVSGRPYYDADGQFAGYRGTGRDVTAEVEAAKALEDARDRAEAANEAKSKFLATMSHEIRTPLNAVLGMAGLLLDSPLSPEQREHIRIVNESGKALLALLNDILDLSKLEAGQVQLEQVDFSAHDVLRNVAALFGPQAEAKGLVLSVDPEVASLSRLRGDSGRLGQIVLNLVSNAIKFTERGSITLSAAPAASADGTLLLRFEVTDTGIGISAENTSRLFHRFTQLESGPSRRYGGTGLGLAICRELTALMGGEIGVDSEPGRGSRFWFTARFTPARGPDALPRPVATATPAGARQAPERRRVLVAEDNPANQRLMEAVLRRAGYHVDIVANGDEAVRAVRALPYDIVLMDAHMPETDGIAATRTIRAMPRPLCDMPIIVLTADALSGDRERYLAAGMSDYLAKPIDTKAVLHAIARHCTPVPG